MMTAIRGFRPSRFFALMLLLLGGCATLAHTGPEADEARQEDLGGLPYHPLVYHLDLSILAYQLYSQTLVWPFDPYYEELNNMRWDRTQFMRKVRSWAGYEGASQVESGAGLASYRGPGDLGGFDNNEGHDPIVYQYSRLYPWSHTITNPDGEWVEYLTPRQITRQIRDVHVSYRESGEPLGKVAIEPLSTVPANDDRAPDARDLLLAFEGGTGDKGEAGEPASQSLMGFVLLRHHRPDSDNYDVHIAFRGSRSGNLYWAIWRGNWTRGAEGNPDWITDLGSYKLGPDSGGGHVSRTGNVHRGFARSTDAILPQLFGALDKAAELRPGGRPDRIYVTGHSLGGALAQHFVSAVLLGDRYGPDGTGAAMPASLRNWPWRQIKLITYGAPRAGDEEWARTLTTKKLESEFFSTPIDTLDRSALKVTDPTIVRRLIDRDRPAGYRVLLTTDPITTEKIVGGKHVGKTVYVNKRRIMDMVTPWLKGDSHEPLEIRALMIAGLADPRIPSTAWRYHAMTDLNPGRDAAGQGSLAEYEKLAGAVQRYYRDNGLWFDHRSFERSFDLFRTLLQSDAREVARLPQASAPDRPGTAPLAGSAAMGGF